MTVKVIDHPGEFDPGEPYDAMCESFRLQVAEMVLEAGRVAIYRDMTWDQQLGSFMAGTLTGLIGVCFAHIREEGRDEMIQGIIDAIPFARQQAEGVFENAEASEGRKA